MNQDYNPPYWLSRTALLLGKHVLQKLTHKHVLVVGLGGVGGICTEMIVRGGVGKITIVDGDVVDESNCNRQIIALQSTVGKSKAEALKQRLLDINPQLEISALQVFLKDDTTHQFLDHNHFDYVVDCIDTLSPKVFLIKACVERNIKIVSSLGAGGKTHSSKVVIADISKTYQCNLARYVRKYLHKVGIRKNIKVVFSPEPAKKESIITTEKAYPKKSIIGTLSILPSIFGCLCADVVLNDLIEND